MREKIKEILMDLRPDVDFDQEDKLIDGHILESADIIALVAELGDEFDIMVKPKHMVAENFNSLDAIAALVGVLAGGQV